MHIIPLLDIILNKFMYRDNHNEIACSKKCPFESIQGTEQPYLQSNGPVFNRMALSSTDHPYFQSNGPIFRRTALSSVERPYLQSNVHVFNRTALSSIECPVFNRTALSSFERQPNGLTVSLIKIISSIITPQLQFSPTSSVFSLTVKCPFSNQCPTVNESVKFLIQTVLQYFKK